MPGQRLSPKRDAALLRCLQPRHCAEQRGFSAAVFTDDAIDFSEGKGDLTELQFFAPPEGTAERFHGQLSLVFPRGKPKHGLFPAPKSHIRKHVFGNGKKFFPRERPGYLPRLQENQAIHEFRQVVEPVLRDEEGYAPFL